MDRPNFLTKRKDMLEALKQGSVRLTEADEDFLKTLVYVEHLEGRVKEQEERLNALEDDVDDREATIAELEQEAEEAADESQETEADSEESEPAELPPKPKKAKKKKATKKT